MSYGAFTKALSDEIGAMQSPAGAPAAIDYQGAERRVLDRWLADGRHEALVRYAVANYDGSQGGEEFLQLLGENLAQVERPDLVRKLYRPIVDRRRNHYFWRKARLQLRWPIPDFMLTLLNRVSSSRRRLARYKLAVLAVMQDFRAVMAMTREPDLADIDRQIAAFIDEAPPARPSAVALASQRMDEEAFWKLIAAARAKREADAEVVATLEASLEVLQPTEIERFQELLCQFLDRSYRWDLWAVAYAARGGCGDDEFDYFRQWLILQGKQVYDAAIADPVGWAVAFEFEGTSQCEDLLSVASDAYRARTGREMSAGKRKRVTKPAGEPWQEDELAIRFPALAARFDLG